jgi:hypothetical protein
LPPARARPRWPWKCVRSAPTSSVSWSRSRTASASNASRRSACWPIRGSARNTRTRLCSKPTASVRKRKPVAAPKKRPSAASGRRNSNASVPKRLRASPPKRRSPRWPPAAPSPATPHRRVRRPKRRAATPTSTARITSRRVRTPARKAKKKTPAAVSPRASCICPRPWRRVVVRPARNARSRPRSRVAAAAAASTASRARPRR